MKKFWRSFREVFESFGEVFPEFFYGHVQENLSARALEKSRPKLCEISCQNSAKTLAKNFAKTLPKLSRKTLKLKFWRSFEEVFEEVFLKKTTALNLFSLYLCVCFDCEKNEIRIICFSKTKRTNLHIIISFSVAVHDVFCRL